MLMDTAIVLERKPSSSTNAILAPLRRLRLACRPNSRDASSAFQSGLTLLKLPYEIREQIYIHVVAAKPMIHIIRHKGPPRRLRAVCCQDIDPYGKPPSLHHCWNEHLWFVNLRNFPHLFGDPKAEGRITGEGNVGALDFLVTCRQVYRELHPLLFSHNIFDLLHIDALTLLAQSSYLPPPSFHTIRHLRLSLTPSANFYHSQPHGSLSHEALSEIYAPHKPCFNSDEAIQTLLPPEPDREAPTLRFEYLDWNNVWSILAHMRGLSTLHVRLNALCDPDCDFESSVNLLRPLMKMRWRTAERGLGQEALVKFAVSVKWCEERFDDLEKLLLSECSEWSKAHMIEEDEVALPFTLLRETMKKSNIILAQTPAYIKLPNQVGVHREL